MSGRSATQPLLAVLAAGVSLLLSTPIAHAQPPEPLIAPIGVAPTQPANTPSRIKLDIGQLSPRVVQADSTGITVAGRITNTDQDRRIDQLEIRLQRGDAVTSEAKLREAMAQPPNAEAVRSPFVQVPGSLEPGASTDFSVTLPIDTLRLDQAGVYPLLVNVNGRPAFGGTERLASLNVLLPVLRGATPPASPAGITLLWPLVDDHPRILQQTVGKQVVLSDDDLANSLSVGGRLYGMLNAVELAINGMPSLAASICYAFDGDLLTTVKAMADGYQVRTADGQTVPGKGKDYAQRWLAKARQLANGQCVVALPYADADLSALSHSDAANLAKNAVELGFSKVGEILDPVKPQQNVLWPVDGTVDQHALADIAGPPMTVLTNPERLTGVSGQPPYTINQNRAVPIDQLVSSALAGDDAGPVSVQNGLATLVFRTALQGASPGQSVLIAPPRRWTAPAAEQRMFLETIGRLYASNLADPRVLQDLVTATATGTASGLDYPQQDTGAELPAQVMADVGQSNTVQRDLLDAMRSDDTTRKDPEDLITPVRTGLLRASSVAWRGNPDGALGVSGDVRTQLDAMRAQVTVNPPGPPITLASSNSPIPLRIGNGLPVAMNVRFVISESAGLRPADIPERRIAAGSTITMIIPAEVLRAGRFTVDVRLTTPRGTALGSTSRIEISSTSYGTITVAVTGVAGGVLVLLAGRRIYRRSRKTKIEQEQTPA
jgi:hypothetical protein